MMNNFQKFRRQLQTRLMLLVMANNFILFGSWLLLKYVLDFNDTALLIVLILMTLTVGFILTRLAVNYFAQPMQLVIDAILHINPETADKPGPDPNSAKFGRELIAQTVHELYEFATIAEKSQQAQKSIRLEKDSIVNSLPVPIVLLDASQNILFANDAAGKYLGTTDAAGKNLYSLLDMSFASSDTFDEWLKTVKDKNVTATMSWERVRLAPNEARPLRLFDLAAYYNKDNPQHIETILVLFDHTKQYSQDDQAMSFIALSVHELRTPLTLLRGYIEAFEDEFVGKLNPEMHDFMFKMSATAQQLTAFVNNILNVARVDEDQLLLRLHEEQWADVIRSAANSLALRAKVRGITLEYTIAPDLPTVGADRVSILEVINNLVDNAIKYSGESKKIRITTYLNPEGLVETTVQDFGVGIPENIMPNLFTKFYRDHHNRAQIGGTGLGLYLAKAIITAHGGNIWVRSKAGQGSTFGFTVLPFSQLADELKQHDDKEIVRGAHGWIKNHSLYRQ